MSDSATTSAGSQGSVPCSVIVRDTALAAMDQHMSDDTAVEYGGVLVGTADPLIGLVIVTAHEPLPDADSSDTVTFSRESWDEMTRVVMARHPGQRIVGWYHSHPRFGIFLSAHDLAIQTTYFSQPWQVAYVFDPVQHERGLFGWSNYDIVRIPEWEIATTVAGINTTLPANVPAHGEFIASRLAEESAAAATTAGAPAQVPSVTTVVGAPATPGAAGGKRRLVAALVVAAVVIGAVIAFLINRDDDNTSTAATTSSTPASAGPETTVEASVTTDVATTAESTTESTASSAPDTTTAPTETASTEPTSTSAVALPTPESVTAPSARVADGTLACTPDADGSYTPSGDCFVPLSNGNLVVYTAGALTCADPAGTVLGPATTFTVGIDADPLVILADGLLVPKCADLSYAKNVLAGGAATLDGLCGSSGTAINDDSLRCFAQNPDTGAIAALVTATDPAGAIAGSCHSAADDPSTVALTWTKSGVDVSWRIVSLEYDPAAAQFVASATRDGVPTTATFACA